MGSRMTIDRKIVGAFASLTLIAVLVGVVGLTANSLLNGHLESIADEALPSLQHILEADSNQEAAVVGQNALLSTGLSRRDKEAIYDEVREAKAKSEAAFAAYAATFRAAERQAVEEFKRAWSGWSAASDEFVALSKRLDATAVDKPAQLSLDIASLENQHRNYAIKLVESATLGRELKVELDPSKCNLGKWLRSFETENPDLRLLMEEIVEPHERLHASAERVQALVGNDPSQALTVVRNESLPALRDIAEVFARMNAIARGAADLYGQMVVAAGQNGELHDRTDSLLQSLVAATKDWAAEEKAVALGQAGVINLILVFSLVAAVGVAATLALFTSRGVTRPLTAAIGNVQAIAKDIAEGSADLAQRTDEQAASIEETASSMEEMTVTVRQNADNADQANRLAGAAKREAEGGKELVKESVSAMRDISVSSKKVVEIISLIDGLAFQTNLLALNAAVEAARAGEHGRGFAVVAGEVRNLASRSAGAAKEIKDLITDSVLKVENGSELVTRMGTQLEEILTATRKVSDIVAEIAAASTQQAAGIDQINQAIAQMDDVTQQNRTLVEATSGAAAQLDQEMLKLQRMIRRHASPRRGNRQAERADEPLREPAPSRGSGRTNGASEFASAGAQAMAAELQLPGSVRQGEVWRDF